MSGYPEKTKLHTINQRDFNAKGLLNKPMMVGVSDIGFDRAFHYGVCAGVDNQRFYLYSNVSHAVKRPHADLGFLEKLALRLDGVRVEGLKKSQIYVVQLYETEEILDIAIDDVLNGKFVPVDPLPWNPAELIGDHNGPF